MAGIAGGMNSSTANGGSNYNNTTHTTQSTDDYVVIRIKGGNMRGSIYGAASFAGASGGRKFIFTGGTIAGWVAGGANGTQTDGGTLYGPTKLYIGGNTIVNSNESNSVINRAVGGNVFGAGCGYGSSSNSGQVLNFSTNVVVADDAYIERGVYGGGSYGYTTNTSNIYILGGHVEGKSGGVSGTSYQSSITGGVYGGACQNQGGTVNINMTGGLVEGGIYGGSNATGTVTGPVTMHIDGGQVGTTSANANIHGGGYGQSTTVSGNVEINLGTCGAASGVTVYGDVYGGSALGTVNTNANNTTTVNLYKGTIYGGLYGGALGQTTPSAIAAAVNGAVAVRVYGGSVLCSASDPQGEAGTGSVFGCNNINGAPQSTVSVDIYNTDQPESGYALHAVYGGGNKAAYSGTPVVAIHGCNNKIEYVYGGGNATNVRGTDVTIWGGTIGNVFGGGNGFSETGNHTDPNAAHYNPGANITNDGTNLKIYGGIIHSAFGGSNQKGYINSSIDIVVEERAETGSDACGNELSGCGAAIVELYGGGNEAPATTNSDVYIAPNVQINSCDIEINNLYGGARKVDHNSDINLVVEGGVFQNVFGGNNLDGIINADITLTIKGGTIENAFGGNNAGGNVRGKITVIVNADGGCPLKIDNVYGGGKDAPYTPTSTSSRPEVNIKNGTVNNAVYGGGFGSGATVTASPIVLIGDPTPAYKAIIGDTKIDGTTGDGNVFGGGNAAGITGSTDVNVRYNSVVKGNVFGGGNAAPVSSNTQVLIRDKTKVFGNIYGGGNMGVVNGNTKVIVNGQ